MSHQLGPMSDAAAKRTERWFFATTTTTITITIAGKDGETVVCSLLAGAMVPAFCWHQAGSLALSQQVPALHHFLLFSFLLPAMKYGSQWLRGYRTRAETKTQQQAQHQYKVHPVGGRSGDVNGEKGAVRKSAKMRDSQTCCILFYQCSGAQSEWWNSQHQHNNHRQWHSAQMDCTFFISFHFDLIQFHFHLWPSLWPLSFSLLSCTFTFFFPFFHYNLTCRAGVYYYYFCRKPGK